jgi:predicted nucleic acid-binding protein
MDIIDSDVLVDLLRGEPRTTAWIASLAVKPHVSGYAAMELVQGARDNTALREVEKLLARFDRLWPSPSAAERAFSFYGRLKLSHNLGLIDALIAASAIEYSATLYSFNTKHFSSIPGMAVRVPYAK